MYLWPEVQGHGDATRMNEWIAKTGKQSSLFMKYIFLWSNVLMYTWMRNRQFLQTDFVATVAQLWKQCQNSKRALSVV